MQKLYKTVIQYDNEPNAPAPTSGASVLATAVAVTSGGSSPSREVQEILSLKDSDLNEFYDESSDLGDDMADEDENDGDSIGIKKNIDEQYNFNETCCKLKINKPFAIGLF